MPARTYDSPEYHVVKLTLETLLSVTRYDGGPTAEETAHIGVLRNLLGAMERAGAHRIIR